MIDYGHELRFGAAMAPNNERPDETVELALVAEAAGLDLATFQDHPYQPRFLDTWTLLSYVAARTTTITLSANVTNLPLRPPAVLARSVASLDLLSRGRVELGLGAGAFWDAIEAMGGRRLAPRDAVRALDEAIEIIRQTWDTGSRGGVRLDGEFYHAAGAKRGPAPAHRVEIWLGAYKPRMLRLTGRRADGWWPSLGYLEPSQLAAGNAVIDAAAVEAGRAPGDIRRLLNISGQFAATGQGFLHGPAKQWAEELAELALTYGVSAFLLGGNDPDAIQRFGAEVAPAVRELVAAERAAPVPAAGSGRTPFAVVPTRDDGHRHSDRQPWDETTRPTGPPRDESRTYTPRQQANGQHLVDVHDHLRAELAQIRDLVDQVAAGTLDAGGARSAINTMTVRQNNWTLGTYCESYCRLLTLHHTLEDRSMFPQLRRADGRLGPVIDRLEHEHEIIHEVLEGVDRALVALVSTPDGMAALRAAVDLLTDSLLSHLAYEERELVEPLARLA